MVLSVKNRRETVGNKQSTGSTAFFLSLVSGSPGLHVPCGANQAMPIVPQKIDKSSLNYLDAKLRLRETHRASCFARSRKPQTNRNIKIPPWLPSILIGGSCHSLLVRRLYAANWQGKPAGGAYVARSSRCRRPCHGILRIHAKQRHGCASRDDSLLPGPTERRGRLQPGSSSSWP